VLLCYHNDVYWQLGIQKLVTVAMVTQSGLNFVTINSKIGAMYQRLNATDCSSYKYITYKLYICVLFKYTFDGKYRKKRLPI